ncbi:MAG TPA: four helix bundle protein [Polyangiales bacterium]|nr:four helix bundle protein [Polyangiales bacterium]
MENKTKATGAQPFVALELALEVIRSLRPVVEVIRKRSPKIADQIVASASSTAANLAEGNGRHAGNRRYHFQVAAGSAEETPAHLRVALAWGWIEPHHVTETMTLIDRQLAVLWRLTH